ncbi:MAG: hypothetical protein ACP5NW_00820 [Candidatus Woesearchaeota archaeon]
MISRTINRTESLTCVKRVYRQKVVSNLTLKEIENMIGIEGIDYSGDYGLKSYPRDVRLVFSLN